MKELYLLRGLPGSGKTFIARSLTTAYPNQYYEADRYFMHGREYRFDASKLPLAHDDCLHSVEVHMSEAVTERLPNVRIVVSNTFTQEWEMEPYFDAAERYGFIVHTLIVENRHGGVNSHGVPPGKIRQMEDRFEIKLR